MGSCPDIQAIIAQLAVSYENSIDMQLDMVENLAQVARARLAQQAAETLSKTLGSDLSEEIARKQAKLESVFLMQWHKETLIREACSFITYQNHGVVTTTCATLLKDPSLSTQDLISHNFADDICQCPTCTRID